MTQLKNRGQGQKPFLWKQRHGRLAPLIRLLWVSAECAFLASNAFHAGGIKELDTEIRKWGICSYSRYAGDGADYVL